VEDDEVIAHNFPHKPDKKVFVTYTLRRNASDSVWRLDGNWKTNLTKRYYAISGKVDAKEEKDLSKSKLYEHLGDLDLQKTLTLNKPKEKTPEKAKEDKNDVAKNIVKKEEKRSAQPVESKPVEKNTQLTFIITDTNVPDTKITSTAINNQPSQTEKKDVVATNTNPVEKKPETNTVKTETKIPDNKTVSNTISNQTDPNEKKNVVATNSTTVDKKPEVPVVKQETKLPDNKPVVAVNNQSNQNEKKDVAATDKKLTENNADGQYEFQELRSRRKLKPAASLVDGRETVPSETIYFKSDSLSIALYDNGEVDGDTVSVIINDVMFVEKQMLKSSAYRKTYYVPQGESDSLLIVLYADNLGKYPPNTGLLQIKDGEDIYYVRFKADFDRNAAIVLRRKYK
jgi:hypothetical protein